MDNQSVSMFKGKRRLVLSVAGPMFQMATLFGAGDLPSSLVTIAIICQTVLVSLGLIFFGVEDWLRTSGFLHRVSEAIEQVADSIDATIDSETLSGGVAAGVDS